MKSTNMNYKIYTQSVLAIFVIVSFLTSIEASSVFNTRNLVSINAANSFPALKHTSRVPQFATKRDDASFHTTFQVGYPYIPGSYYGEPVSTVLLATHTFGNSYGVPYTFTYTPPGNISFDSCLDLEHIH